MRIERFPRGIASHAAALVQHTHSYDFTGHSEENLALLLRECAQDDGRMAEA